MKILHKASLRETTQIGSEVARRRSRVLVSETGAAASLSWQVMFDYQPFVTATLAVRSRHPHALAVVSAAGGLELPAASDLAEVPVSGDLAAQAGRMSIATACLWPGSPAADVAALPDGNDKLVGVEHPPGAWTSMST